MEIEFIRIICFNWTFEERDRLSQQAREEMAVTPNESWED